MGKLLAPQRPDQKHAMNRVLMSHGLGTLDDPGVVAQMAYLVQDHDHFRSMLMACEPVMRGDMYRAMAPNLRFPARPLEDYIIEGKRLAEAAQLPIQDEEGNLHPFSPPALESQEFRDKQIANQAVADQLSNRHLRLVCKKCTREQIFHGATRAGAIKDARDAGWTYDEVSGDGREICPDCP
jgi:hypothetical protein